jgi:hypothetical protein
MTPLPLLVLEARSGTKFLTISTNPTLWTLFGSYKELGGASQIIDNTIREKVVAFPKSNPW